MGSNGDEGGVHGEGGSRTVLGDINCGSVVLIFNDARGGRGGRGGRDGADVFSGFLDLED